jgi:hypothetical protein
MDHPIGGKEEDLGEGRIHDDAEELLDRIFNASMTCHITTAFVR